MRWKKLLTPAGSMDAEELRQYIEAQKEGTYTLLDVRQPAEYEREHIPGSVLIPLPELHDRIGELDPEKPIIPY
jgi:rhodanese-related sulfurtransferase